MRALCKKLNELNRAIVAVYDGETKAALPYLKKTRLMTRWIHQWLTLLSYFDTTVFLGSGEDIPPVRGLLDFPKRKP